jgi:sulfopyruvate decarboxylase beta subunit
VVLQGLPETQREVPLMRNIQRPLRKFFRRYTRFDFIEALASILNGEVVVSNLGIPSKELFYIRHRPLNFYMLGSMGMATAIGTGLSLFTDRRVIAIDGDGSLLMNPGTLGTVASLSPENLFVVAIDNGSYGSTGDQPTLSSRCVDLEAVARAFGIMRTQKTDSPRELVKILRNKKKGPFFIHVIARPGNKEVPDIPLTPLEIRELFSNALLQDGSP